MGRISALKWPKGQEPWRRGATGFCKLSWQLLVVVKLWLLFPIVSHLRLFLVVYAWWILLQSWGTMGHDALQRPSWPQAQRRASHRQHDGSQADKVKDHRRRQGRGLPHGPHLVMLLSVSAVMAQHRLGYPEKSRRLSKRLSFASSFFQLQRLSSERTQVRHRLSDAEQSSVIPAVRRLEQSDTISSFILDTALRQSISSKRHSSSGRAEGTTGLPRSAQGSDHYSRVAARMISNLQKLVISSRQSSSGDPFAEADTASQLDDHLCPKGYSVEGSKVLQRPRKYDPAATTAGTRETEVEEGEQPKATDVEP